MSSANYYDGLNEKLFKLIPRSARKVLELGCANGQLGRAFKAQNPCVHWSGVDISTEALAHATQHLDAVFHTDLNQTRIQDAVKERAFDTIVIGNLLEHLIHPEKVLTDLLDISTGDVTLVCCIPNMTHFSVIQRLLTGDMSYDAHGLLDKTHLRFFSPASSCKMFLDSGWLPDMQDSYTTAQADTRTLQGLLHVTTAMAIPPETAFEKLHLYQMVFKCQKRNDVATHDTPTEKFKISVVVPVNREWEADLNIARSPGLQELDAQMIVIRDARSAAHAFELGKQQSQHDWILFLHQDVYIPKYAGTALAKTLRALQAQTATPSVLGFAGIGVQAGGQLHHAGLVVDRKTLFCHPPTDHAISIDELAIVMHKNGKLQLDASLGWHTWATDLCLQAHLDASVDHARIVNIPLFHNSTNNYKLPDAYHASAKILKNKYPQIPSIKTLCGDI